MTSQARFQAQLVTLTAAIMGAAMLFLLLVWLLTGDLEGTTVLAALALSGILTGLSVLAWRKSARVALWILSALLMGLIGLDSAAFGLDSPSVLGLAIPVLLVTRGFGLRFGVGAALAGSAFTWGIALASVRGVYIPFGVVDLSHLTFNAPALTVILLIVAILGGWQPNEPAR